MTDTGTNTGVNSEQLRHFVNQIVMSEREKAGIATDIKEYYGAAKDAGLDTKAIRRAVKWEMASPTKREQLQEEEDRFDRYMQALGMFD